MRVTHGAPAAAFVAAMLATCRNGAAAVAAVVALALCGAGDPVHGADIVSGSGSGSDEPSSQAVTTASDLAGEGSAWLDSGDGPGGTGLYLNRTVYGLRLVLPGIELAAMNATERLLWEAAVAEKVVAAGAGAAAGARGSGSGTGSGTAADAALPVLTVTLEAGSVVATVFFRSSVGDDAAAATAAAVNAAIAAGGFNVSAWIDGAPVTVAVTEPAVLALYLTDSTGSQFFPAHTPPPPPPSWACPGRSYITPDPDELGIIRSNPGASEQYANNRSCEWLIDAPTNSTLELRFTSFDTECSFDYVFVYDGLEYDPTKLLASLSGDQGEWLATDPEALFVASSGKMLVRFSSDENYVRSGFSAQFVARVNTTSNRTAPATGRHQRQGRAVSAAARAANAGWQRGTPAPTPRAGHSMVAKTVGASSDLWVFGGHSLQHTLGDVAKYSVASEAWSVVSTAGIPPAPRYWHSAQVHSGSMYVFGGAVGNAVPPSGPRVSDPTAYSDELWALDLSATATWSQPAVTGVKPPALALHTATVWQDQMLVIGGKAPGAGPRSDVYSLNLAASPKTWSLVETHGALVQVAGHAAVLHPDSELIYVFGGYSPSRFGHSQRTNDLFTYSPKFKFWTRREPYGGAAVPAVALHSMVLVHEHLVVFGGQVHRHDEDEVCYAPSVLAYSTSCDEWIPSAWPYVTGADAPRGRFSHAAVAQGGGMYVHGGFSGIVRQDVQLFTAPTWSCNTSFTTPSSARCGRLRSCRTCATDDGCAWSHDDVVCSDRALSVCSTTFGVHDHICDPRTCDNRLPAQEFGVLVEYWTSEYRRATGAPPASRHRTAAASVIVQNVDYVYQTLTGTLLLPTNGKNKTDVYGFKLTQRNGDARAKFTRHVNETFFDEARNSTTVRRKPIQVLELLAIEGSELFVGNLTIDADPMTVLVEQQSKPAVNTTSRRDTSLTLSWTTYSGASAEDTVWQVLGGSQVAPPMSTSCEANTDCGECTADPQCNWCHKPNSTAAAGCVKRSAKTCDRFAAEPPSCVECSAFTTCDECFDNPFLHCSWSAAGECVASAPTTTTTTTTTTATTVLGSTSAPTAAPIAPSGRCPAKCSTRTTCASCLEPDSAGALKACAWCESTATCMDFAEYPLTHALGQCRAWHQADCVDCAMHSSCDACHMQAECGWCHSPFDRDYGSCTAGDASRFLVAETLATYSDAELVTCGAFYNPPPIPAITLSNGTVINATLHENSTLVNGTWSYEMCPDRDECALGVDECGANSTCFNLNPGTYVCQCDQHFHLAPANETHDGSKLCAPDCCSNATCSSPWDCNCDPGWAGVNCTIDCGCNFHAECIERNDSSVNNSYTVAFGQCGECLHNTIGETCDQCAPGFYGDPRNGSACAPCDCDGHGDPERGLCDAVTGKCHCLDLTTGDHCESCLYNLWHGGTADKPGICYVPCGLPNRKPGPEGRSFRYRLTERKLGLTTLVLNENKVDSLCAWLIEAPSSNYTITLEIESLNTECGYDIVHVFDNDDPHVRNQLGGYAGTHSPADVVSHTGKMLVTFLTDANFVLYERPALQARYEMSLCPSHCSGHGNCTAENVCECESGYGGIDCATELCPNSCTNGVCDPVTSSFCVCNAGVAGKDCNATMEKNTWSAVNQPPADRNVFVARHGHTTVYDSDTDVVWLFGGNTLREMLGDVLTFGFDAARAKGWEVVSAGGDGRSPVPRYMHAACLGENAAGKKTMFVHGGSTGAGDYLDDLWEFDLAARSWTQLNGSTSALDTGAGHHGSRPIAVMGHTATCVGQHVYVFGGLTEFGLGSSLHRYDIADDTWSVVYGAPNRPHPDGVWSHSAVYDEAGQQIIYFGGKRRVRYNLDVLYDYDVWRSGIMQSFSLVDQEWRTLAPELGCPPHRPDCQARSSHSAVLATLPTGLPGVNKTYMLVFGGCPFTHGHGDPDTGTNFECHSHELLVVDLTCGASLGWISVGGSADARHLEALAAETFATPRSRHTAVYRPASRSMHVFGGFDGAPLSDMPVYLVPDTFCDRHENDGIAFGLGPGEACKRDVMCTWDANSSTCNASATLGADHRCDRHLTNTACADDWRCLWRNGTAGNSTQRMAEATCEPIVVDNALPACPLSTNANGLFECSTEIWGMCNEGAHSTCNLTQVCDSCAANPSCAACSNVWFQGIPEKCNGAAVKCLQRSGQVSEKAQVGLCSSSCGSKKSCYECTTEPGCHWDDSTRFCHSEPPEKSDGSPGPSQTHPSNCTMATPCRALNTSTACKGAGAYGNCMWCESLGVCTSKEAKVTEYTLGQCLIWPGNDLTDAPCAGKSDCDSCLRTPRCGWCASPGLLGQGVCELGDWAVPHTADPSYFVANRSVCGAQAALGERGPHFERAVTVQANRGSGAAPDGNASAATASGAMVTEVYAWDFWDCRDEDECALKVDDCDNETNATCVNTDSTGWEVGKGFECTCPPNLQLNADERTCEPKCELHGCIHGHCVARDVCECNFGWAGPACDVDCGCNFHSTCNISGPVALGGACDKCENNTQGEFCHECAPGHHGNATHGAPPYAGQCRACVDVCNGNNGPNPLCKQHPSDPGPVCQNCGNNTHGSKCDKCNPGYFIAPELLLQGKGRCDKESLGFKDIQYCTEKLLEERAEVHAKCVPCDCNGHGTGVCNNVTGENCTCQNHTRTDEVTCTERRAKDGSCHAVQCAACKSRALRVYSAQVSEQSSDGTATLTPTLAKADKVDVITNNRGGPSDGSFCYLVTEIDTVSRQQILPGEVHAFQAKPRFTNLEIQMIFDADADSAIGVFITVKEHGYTRFSPPYVDGAGPVGAVSTAQVVPSSWVVHADPDGFAGRKMVSIKAADYSFRDSTFLIHIHGIGRPGVANGTEALLTSYDFFYTQPKLKLDLVVFFTVFFSVFYLLIALASYPVVLKAAQVQRQLEAQEQQQMEVMAHRPMASVLVLMADRVLGAPGMALRIAALQAQRLLPPTAVATQPHHTGGASLSAFLVELPAHRAGGPAKAHRRVCIGCALTKPPEAPQLSRAEQRLERRRSSEVRDTAL